VPNAIAQAKTLGSEVELGNVLFVLFIPSKDKDGKGLNDTELWTSAAGDKLTDLFGGATEMPPAKGKWFNEESKKIITESVVLIHSYASEAMANDENRIKCIGRISSSDGQRNEPRRSGRCHRRGVSPHSEIQPRRVKKMSKVNQFAISAILNSEIVGRFEVGHGQIDCLGDAQHFLDLRGIVQAPAEIHGDEKVDKEKVKEAFLQIRNARGDRGSSDLYIAEQERNSLFLGKCRQLGLKVSDYILNKTLLNARKNKLLTGLGSIRTSIDYEDIAFACEFAATELKYKLGVSIDDIVCDPLLSAQFDEIATKLSPGHTSFEYRWAILSIRKSGRSVDWKDSYKMPRFEGVFKLANDPLDKIPADCGAYILYENSKSRPLYARSTQRLRHAIDLHRQSKFIDAILDKFWQPNPNDFLIKFAQIPTKMMLKPVERKIIEDEKPLFNVPRVAA
jgi:hypothetical protein